MNSLQMLAGRRRPSAFQLASLEGKPWGPTGSTGQAPEDSARALPHFASTWGGGGREKPCALSVRADRLRGTRHGSLSASASFPGSSEHAKV